MYDTFNKCNIEEFEGYLYHIHDKKIMFLGTFETNPHSFSWKINEYFDCDKFWKENAPFYENYYQQQNIFFYFKLKNKKDFVKFKLLYKEN